MKKKDLLKKIEALETRIIILESKVKFLQEGWSWTWPIGDKPEGPKFEPLVVTKGTSCDAEE